MTVEYSPSNASSLPHVIFESRERRTVASYERELTKHRRTEIGLRELLAHDEALLGQKDELIQQQTVLSEESDHRLLNSLQMIVSLLSLQSRASDNAEVSSQLAAAADRITTIGRIHRRLHSLDGVQTFAFKQYLEDLCRDFSLMLSSEHAERAILVEGIEIEAAERYRHSAWLRRQRTDHERRQIRHRPDYRRLGSQSRKGLHAVRLQRRARLARRVRSSCRQGTGNEDYSDSCQSDRW